MGILANVGCLFLGFLIGVFFSGLASAAKKGDEK